MQHLQKKVSNSLLQTRLTSGVFAHKSCTTYSRYAQLVKDGTLTIGSPMNVVVPTGNFGNILAAYYAKGIGVPINKLICASNENDVLVDFFQTGTYNRLREFKLTSSPSMDILVSSNLERFVFELTGRSSKETNALMNFPKRKRKLLCSKYRYGSLQAILRKPCESRRDSSNDS